MVSLREEWSVVLFSLAAMALWSILFYSAVCSADRYFFRRVVVGILMFCGFDIFCLWADLAAREIRRRKNTVSILLDAFCYIDPVTIYLLHK